MDFDDEGDATRALSDECWGLLLTAAVVAVDEFLVTRTQTNGPNWFMVVAHAVPADRLRLERTFAPNPSRWDRR
jgi:hypothetical protein